MEQQMYEDYLKVINNKRYTAFALIMGILFTVAGGAGIILDCFYPKYAAGFHDVLGSWDIGRLAIGLVFLAGYTAILEARKAEQEKSPS